MSNPSLRKFIYKTYTYSFFNSFVFLYPLYAIMFSDFGISNTKISILFMFWSVAVLITQIPIGIIADRYPRRYILAIGQIFKAIAFITWITFPNFSGAMLGFFFWGIQWATYNIFEAFIYDELKCFRKKKIYAKICGNNHAVQIIGYALSSLGSFLLPLGYDIITFISVFFVLISGLVIYTNKSATISCKPQHQSYLITLLIGSRILTKNLKLLFTLIMLTLIIGLAYIDEYFGLIGLEMGVRKEYVGLIFIAITISESIGSWIAYRFEKISDTKMYSGVVFLGLIFISISFNYNYFGIAILSFFYLIYAVLRVLLLARFQHDIKSQNRGTILAFYGIFEQFSSIGSYAIMMLAASLGNYKYGFFMLGSIVSLIGLIYSLVLAVTKKKPIPPLPHIISKS